MLSEAGRRALLPRLLLGTPVATAAAGVLNALESLQRHSQGLRVYSSGRQTLQQAAVAAVVRVASSEAPGAAHSHSLVSESTQASKLSPLVALSPEIAGRDTMDDHGASCIPRLLPVAAVENLSLAPLSSVKDMGSTAVITGGLGGLGQLAALWLTQTCALAFAVCQDELLC